MAAYKLERLKGVRGGSFDVKGKRDHTLKVRVWTDNKFDGSLTVGTYVHNNGYPLGSQHPEDPLSFLQRIDPREHRQNPKVWECLLTYSRVPRDPNDPTADPVDVRFGNEKRQVPVYTVKCAGDLIDPAPLKDSNFKLAIVKLTMPGNIPSYVLDYEDAVNNDSYTIGGLAVAAFRSKCSPWDIATEDTRGGVKVRVAKFSILISKKDIRLYQLDYGFRERDGANKLVNITNEDGTPITSPALLDGAGAALADPTPANAVNLLIGEDRGGYDELPFAGNLPGCV